MERKHPDTSYKGGPSPESCASPSPDHYQFSNYPTPRHPPAASHDPHPTPGHLQSFFPVQQLPAPAGRTQHQHAFASHYNTSHGTVPQLSFRSENDTALLEKNLLDSYGPPTLAKPESSSFAQVPPPTPTTSVATRGHGPYFGQPPLPPLPNPAVSPNDEPRRAATSALVYRNSPYFSEAPNLDAVTGSSESSTSSGGVTARPVPARSAFMCFSETNGQAISDRLGADKGKGRFVEVVAAEWRGLSKQDKAYWEEMAKNEKTRFANEKKAYKGPITRKLRAKKNPLAPKRPMSAFLMYAQQRRRPLQRENPDMSNADISRLLGEVWRNTSVADKRPFLEREESERRLYKAKVEAWKNDAKLMKALTPPTAAAKRATGARKKEACGPRFEREAAFAREEAHCDQRHEPVKSIVVSHPRNEETSYQAFIANSHPTGSYTVDQEAVVVGKQQAAYYEFNTSNWSPSHNQQNSGRHRKYTYPRPP